MIWKLTNNQHLHLHNETKKTYSKMVKSGVDKFGLDKDQECAYV